MSLSALRLSRFRRITSGGNFIPEIDGLRFIAIISVLLVHVSDGYLQRVYRFNESIDFDPAKLPAVYHGWYWAFRLFSHGGRGVEIFFVISGLILGLPFARQRLLGTKPVPLSAYFWRRITRLEPPYILSLLIRTALFAAAATYPMAVLLPHLGASLIYGHNLIYRTSPLISAVAWSLEIEVQFYCLAPLLALVFLIRPALLRRLLLVLAAVVLSFVQPPVTSFLHITLLGFLQYFLIGFLLADLYASDRLRQASIWWDLAAPLWIVLFWLRLPEFSLAAPLMLLLLFIAAFKGVAVRGFLALPLVSTIGGMCYSIYLTHMAVAAGVLAVMVRLHAGLLVSMAAAVCAAIVLGALYFLLIERPCMDKEWPQKLAAWIRQRKVFAWERRPAIRPDAIQPEPED